MSKLQSVKMFLNKWGGLLRIILVAGIFSFLIFTIKPSEFIIAFKNADRKYFLIALFLLLPNLSLQVFKWRYILSLADKKPSWGLSAYSLLGGFFLGAASPSRTGELARGFLMPGYSKVKIASLTILDKGLNQLAIAMGGLFSLTFVLPLPFSIFPPFVLAIIAISIIYVNKLKKHFYPLLSKFINEAHIENALAIFDLVSPRNILKIGFVSFVFYSVFILQYYMMVRSFTDISLITAFKTLPIVYLVNLALPISFGEYGVKEMASYQLLTKYGIAGQCAVSATFAQNTLVFLIPSIIGGILMILSKIRK